MSKVNKSEVLLEFNREKPRINSTFKQDSIEV